jgi:hypothetical protein
MATSDLHYYNNLNTNNTVKTENVSKLTIALRILIIIIVIACLGTMMWLTVRYVKSRNGVQEDKKNSNGANNTSSETKAESKSPTINYAEPSQTNLEPVTLSWAVKDLSLEKAQTLFETDDACDVMLYVSKEQQEARDVSNHVSTPSKTSSVYTFKVKNLNDDVIYYLRSAQFGPMMFAKHKVHLQPNL